MIKIWVGNLGKYNEGELVGEWFTLPADIGEIMETIGVRDGTEYEEHFIADFEAPSFLDIGEGSSIKMLNQIAEALEELTELQLNVLATLLSERVLNGSGKAILESIEIVKYKVDIEYRILTGHATLADIAKEYAIESGFVQDSLLMGCVNFHLYAKELALHTTHYQVNEGVWVEWIE